MDPHFPFEPFLLGKRAAAPAWGLWLTPRLRQFFGDLAHVQFGFWPVPALDFVMGWGRKSSSRVAGRLAGAVKARLLIVEDGFLRSVGVGRSGAAPISLVADDLGVYFDARAPSRLEMILSEAAMFSSDLLAQAAALRAEKNRLGLTKYNAGAPLRREDLPETVGARILVLDQTAADASIAGAMAGPHTFSAMIAAARRENPKAQIIVKRHPEAAAGYRKGQFSTADLRQADVVLDRDVDLMALVARVDRVYTVSSLAGADALLQGKAVRCFGAPWYAGWGLTEDEIPLPRRAARLTHDQLFAGAYLRYARYVDPITGAPCGLELALRRLGAFKRHAERVRGTWAAFHISPAKQPVVRRFFNGPTSRVRFLPAGQAGRVRADGAMAWASKPQAAETLQAAAAPVKAFLEDGFIRSVGLGSSFYPAASFALDRGGIYYDPASASTLFERLRADAWTAQDLAAARALREAILALKITKYNLGGAKLQRRAKPGQAVILVPGQVSDDASIQRGGAGLTNLALLQTVRAARPGAYILFKEHPDVRAGNRAGAIAATEIARLADEDVSAADILDCIEAADEVHTITSLTGFEALLRGKAVVTYGVPFYAGWGLTDDRAPSADRGKTITLDALVAGALGDYPLYLEPVSGLPIDALSYLEFLAAYSSKAPNNRLQRRPLLRFLRAAEHLLALRGNSKF